MPSEPTSRPNSVWGTSSSNRKPNAFGKPRPLRRGFSFAPPQLRSQLVQMALRLELDHHGNTWSASGAPTDLSIPVNPISGLPRAWYRGPAHAEPVRSDGWTGSVAEGGSVNFRDITFNPHAHGTHTETREHIHDAFQPIDAMARSQQLPFLQPAILIDAPLCHAMEIGWSLSRTSSNHIFRTGAPQPSSYAAPTAMSNWIGATPIHPIWMAVFRNCSLLNRFNTCCWTCPVWTEKRMGAF